MVYQYRLGTNTVIASNTVGTIPVGSAVPVDYTVIISLAWDNGTTSIPTISSVTDGRSNTYTTTSSAGTGNSTVSDMILSSKLTTALQAGDTITVTIGAARVRWCLEASAFGSVGAFDQNAANHNATNTSSGSLTTNASGSTTYPSELVVAAFGFGTGRTITVPGGWTATGTSVETAAGATDRALQTIFTTVSTTGAQTGTLTISPNSVYTANLSTFQLLQAPLVPMMKRQIRAQLVR